MLPHKVKIGAFTYEVRPYSETHPNPNGQGEILGECHTKEQTIEVSTQVNEDFQTAILIHEVIHAIANHANLDLNEIQVDLLGQGVHALLKDNRAVRKLYDA